MSDKIYDLLVIGGGINGVAVAADAAGRGLSTVLVEKGDLGGATSSASSKLIHGGLRYLEHLEFRLVREALAEREVLLRRAPHIVWPLRFILPHAAGMRSRALIRTGLFLYDHLSRRTKIPGSHAVDLGREAIGPALQGAYRSGWCYWDCWVDDSRLVTLTARLAAERGALILTRTQATGLRRGEGSWTVAVRSPSGERQVRVRVIVNAAGPWAGFVGGLVQAEQPEKLQTRVRLVKGSHIVVPRISTSEDALILQSPDGRVIFVLPFEERFSLIGTTDVPVEGDPGEVSCSPEERDYLIEAVNRFLAVPLSAGDVVWSFAGVRPLQNDGGDGAPSSLSRDYNIELEGTGAGHVLLTIIGGKVTTHRRLAETVMDRLRCSLPHMGAPWTAQSLLPGGDIPKGDLPKFVLSLQQSYPLLPAGLIAQLARRHGTNAAEILGDARELADLGEEFCGGLTEREVIYLARHEWAQTPEDVLWRRTKAGLALPSAASRARVETQIQRVIDQSRDNA